MPLRVPHRQLVVHRNGKNVWVPIGKPFDFTAEEIEHFHANQPASMRRVIHEAVPVPVAEPEVTSEAVGAATPAPPDPAIPTAPKKVVGAKKPAAAPDPDENDEL